MVKLRAKAPPPGVMWVVRDRFGRSITLTEERWEHIIRGHVSMDGLEMAVKGALEKADETRRGNTPDSEIVYGRDLGPARWLAVVVAFEAKAGFILTAYPQTKDLKADGPTEGH